MAGNSRLLAPLLVLFLLGCGGGVREKVITIPAGDPLAHTRTLLQRYIDGQPLASEVESFPDMVANLRKSDPERADILEKGLNEIKASPSSRAAIAKKLLPKFQPTTR